MFVLDGFIRMWEPLTICGQSTVKNISEHPSDAKYWLRSMRKCKNVSQSSASLEPVTFSNSQALDHGLPAL